MSVVTIHQAKTQLSRLIAMAERGEEVIIARGSEPVARLVALSPVAPRPRFGGWEGEVWMAEDFAAPLDDFSAYMPDAGQPDDRPT